MVKLVQEYFSNSAKKYPNHPFFDLDENFCPKEHREELKKNGIFFNSFRELDDYSNQLARHLKENFKIKKGDRIAFMFKKTHFSDSIASILAILKCGAIYIPIHYSLPSERIAKILSDSGAKLLICLSIFARELKKNLPQDFVFLELNAGNRNKIRRKSIVPLNYIGYKSSDVAYIMYTSGSTGEPKGVQITHSNIINATDWAVDELGITHEDKMSQHPPLNFDLSTFDLFCAFKAGATLYPVDEVISLFPNPLLKFIEDNKLTIWNSVPSVMVYLWNSGLVQPNRLPNLKKIFFNGEGFPTKYLAEWMKIFPQKEFVNMYGPTETTVQCSFYKIPSPPKDLTKLVPIGKACRGVEIFDVDGELYVAGKGVGVGYWKNKKRTKESFVKDPRKGKTGIVYKTGDLVKKRKDGNYEFIGRKDNQVKIHGNRIELGDIDAGLYSLPYVKEVATIIVQDKESSDSFLVSFVDLKSKMAESNIKKDLNKILPAYMIPKKVIETKLPKTSTGKIDRVKLKNEYTKN